MFNFECEIDVEGTSLLVEADIKPGYHCSASHPDIKEQSHGPTVEDWRCTKADEKSIILTPGFVSSKEDDLICEKIIEAYKGE